MGNGETPAVISMSLGGKGSSWAERRAVERATKAGIAVVVAAGNEGQTGDPDACHYTPAGIRAAITVGSIDHRDHRSVFSNSGKCVDIFAPGSGIKSCWSTGDEHLK